ncbi:hypothetical protein EI94DRAFT_1705042 [Lactarius quietus]|nr:hypothetical protein EI94DRAFT_1705042 [Lactarius quietus]
MPDTRTTQADPNMVDDPQKCCPPQHDLENLITSDPLARKKARNLEGFDSSDDGPSNVGMLNPAVPENNKGHDNKPPESDNQELEEEDDVTELNTCCTDLFGYHLSKKWEAPIYVFFTLSATM